MLGNHKAIVIPQSTPYAAEMRKHEAYHTQFGAPGRPYVYREFPKMVYRAFTAEKGGIDFEPFVVNTEDEQRNMQSRGYAVSQELALQAHASVHLEHGKLAAEREYEIAHGRLSERAVAEVRAAEAEHGARHLPSVPETPVKRRGRPRKVEVGAE